MRNCGHALWLQCGHPELAPINGNLECLSVLVHRATRAWFKWLNRRSDRSSYTWKRFQDFLKTFPLPLPRVKVQIWAR